MNKDKPLRRVMNMPIKERLENNTVLDPETSCLIWQLAKSRNGYGVIKYEGKKQKAHRLAYEIFVGPLQPGSVVHHTCSTRACVNPEHLQQISAQNNVAEMLERSYYINRIAELEKEIADGKQA